MRWFVFLPVNSPSSSCILPFIPRRLRLICNGARGYNHSRCSLTASPASQRLDPCVVPTVPSLADLNYSSSLQLRFSTYGILASNTYLPPFRAVTCEAGPSRCVYNVSFVGPAFDCVDVSSQTNFTAFFNQTSIDPVAAPYPIWEPILTGVGDPVGTPFSRNDTIARPGEGKGSSKQLFGVQCILRSWSNVGRGFSDRSSLERLARHSLDCRKYLHGCLC